MTEQIKVATSTEQVFFKRPRKTHFLGAEAKAA